MLPRGPSQEAQEAEEELIAKLALNEQWEDPEFPASGKSLYHDPHDPPRGEAHPPLDPP